MDAIELRWLIASTKERTPTIEKAIELAGGDDALALDIANDLLEGTARKIAQKDQAKAQGVSDRTIRRRKGVK